MTRAVAAGALLFGALVGLVGCGKAPLDLAYDLAARAPVAERVSSADVILFGTPESDARLGAGIDEEPTPSPEGAYRAASLDARVRLAWNAIEPRVAILDAAPWAGIASQSIEVFLNDGSLERLEMSPERHRYLVPLPSRLQREGENTLRFVFPKAVKEGSLDRAAALYSLVVGSDAESSLVDLVDRGAPSPFAAVVENGVPGLDLVGPAGLRFALLLPASAELRFTPVLHPVARHAGGAVAFLVLLQREDGEEVEVFRREVGAADPEAGEQVVHLESTAGEPVRLTLAVEAAGSPRFAWGRFVAPRVLGRGGADLLRRTSLSPADEARADGLRRGLSRAGANVVFVILDAARARQFGVYGYGRPTTPEIDRIAADSAVFDHAYTPAVFTLAAMSSTWTSLYPDEVHASAGLKSRLPEDRVTLAEVLSGPEVLTAGFTANPMAGRAYDLSRGFDEFFEVFSERGTGAAAFREVVPAWLAAHKSQRFFAYIHYREPHFPYDAPPPWDTRFGSEGAIPKSARLDWEVFRRYNRGLVPFGPAEEEDLVNLYDGSLAFVDHEVGLLRDALVALDLWDKTVFILAADHGEALHERGYTGHNVEVYETSARVPLIVRLPPSLGVAPRRVEALASHLDLAPTIADVFGRRGASGSARQFRGRSLLPVIEGAPGSPAVLTRSVWESPRYALRDPSYVFVYDTRGGHDQLFDRRTDPDEEHDILSEKPLRAAVYRETIRAFLLGRDLSREEASGEEARLSPEQCENLRSLGYVQECP